MAERQSRMRKGEKEKLNEKTKQAIVSFSDARNLKVFLFDATSQSNKFFCSFKSADLLIPPSLGTGTRTHVRRVPSSLVTFVQGARLIELQRLRLQVITLKSKVS